MRSQTRFSILVSLLACVSTAGAWFTVPPGPGVTVVLDSQDNQFSWYAGPADQQEWLNNLGGNASTRVKGWQDVTGLKFDLAAYRGQRVVAAELHLARANADLVTSLVAATINADWNQATACWRYRALPGTEWTFPHSDFSAATFGNFGSLVSYGFGDGDGDTGDPDTYRTYDASGFTWIAMVLDPALVQALILDQYGLAVTDPRLHLSFGLNPRVYTREQNATVQPRLFVQFAPSADVAGPAAAGELTATAGDVTGSVVLRFRAPVDAEEPRAFGYDVRHATNAAFAAAAPVDRWRIPRPQAPGNVQHVLIEDLPPGTTRYFFVQAYDTVGNTGSVAQVRFHVPAPVPPTPFADGGLDAPDPSGMTVRTAGGVLRYFAASEVAKINPLTGNRIEDGYTGSGADDYKKANVVWNAASNAISLAACRNEMVGVQLIVQRLGGVLSGVAVDVSDLTGPGGAVIPAATSVERFQLHAVSSGASRYGEVAIPLQPPFPTTFDIPDANHNPGGVYQSVYLDLFVPPATPPGAYTGAVTIGAVELGGGPVAIALHLRVSPVALPDANTFTVDLNGYGNPWDFGPDHGATCLRYFQTVHKHRAVPNTLPYGWSGNVQADRAPTLAGNGPTRHAASWSVFDAKYGRFFTRDPAQSAFNSAQGYVGPGVNTPITHFYTPFHEMWPQSLLDPTHGFDAAGQGPAYWDGLRASANYATLFTTCPDVRQAFPEGYRQAQRQVMSDWLRHAASNGWTQTAFENYLNHKYTYGGTHALWVLEECETADDFRAVGFFHELWREGQTASGVTNVPWHFRIDISDRWGQHYGQLDNRVNWVVMGSGAAGWHWPSKRYRAWGLEEDRPEDWIWYGRGAPVGGDGADNARLCLEKWCQGFNGGLPYWNSYNTQWTTADDGTPCVVYAGANVPGFGLYSGPLISHRLKQLRQVQQIIELLNLWAAAGGMDRARVREALVARYGDGTWDYTFATLDELRLHQLRADLMAQLEWLALREVEGPRVVVK